jgi:maltooligosyltrehalose trehalohydrolase
VAELIVWAPNARRVEVEVELELLVAGPPATGQLPRERRLLQRGDRGYFSLASPGLPAGARYLLRLDAGAGLPDPRSSYQPDGIHGPS